MLCLPLILNYTLIIRHIVLLCANLLINNVLSLLVNLCAIKFVNLLLVNKKI